MFFVAPETLPVNISELRTPIEEAKSHYNRMRRAGGFRKLRSHEDRMMFLTFRHFSNYTRDWRRSHKDALHDQIRASLFDTQEWLREANEFIEWYESQIVASSRHHVHQFFLRKVQATVDVVQDSYASFDLEDPDMGLVEQAASAGESLGLELYDPYTDRDDGMVWFKDPDSDHLYMFALSFLATQGRRFNTGQALYAAEPPRGSRWREAGIQPLNTSCMFGGGSHLPNPMRVFRDYHGMFSDIEHTINKDESPLPFP